MDSHDEETTPKEKQTAYVQTIRFTMPAKMAGRIIGKEGRNIKNIIALSQARCWFDNEEHPDPALTSCIIQGTVRQVREAKKLIDKQRNEIIEAEETKKLTGKEPKRRTNEEKEDCDQVQVLQFWLDDDGLVIMFTAMLTSQEPEVTEVNGKLEAANRKPKNLANLNLAVGGTCAVQTPSGWRRAQLLGCEEGCDARVFLIDEGTRVTVPTALFSPLPKQLSLLPALTRTYKLAVTPISKAAAETAVERLTANICNKKGVVLDVSEEEEEDGVPEASILYLGSSVAKFLTKENLL